MTKFTSILIFTNMISISHPRPERNSVQIVLIRNLHLATTFSIDRGHDEHKMVLKLNELKQNYVERLTAKSKLLYCK
ncbi:MAG: hypothetical protein ACM3X7_06715 [Solirubrobacterales bacterium]